MGFSACWVTRSMGITTFWTRTPEGAAVPVAVPGMAAVVPVVPDVTGGSVVRVDDGDGVTPSLVST